MPKFLFWNLGGGAIPAALIQQLAESNDVDILLFAECRIEPATVLRALNEVSHTYRFAERVLCERLLFFTRFDAKFLSPIIYESERISIRRLELPGRQRVILAAAHLPSKMHASDESQVHECVNLADEVARAERAEGHQRTILVGDFNVNPFESGLVGTRGLNAVMSRRIALKGSRTVQGRSYPFFFNPMWGHFGDRADGPAGTFYYDKAEHVTYYWNMFDQFLIRPEIARSFQYDHARILTNVGSVSLLQGDGRPDKVSYSDHLPITLEIDF